MVFSVLEWKKSELVFVVGVVVAVFGVSFWQLKLGEMKTRDAQRKADTELVARALKVYFEEHGEYPESDGGRIVACGRLGIEVCLWGEGEVRDSDGVVYLRRLPQDPQAEKRFNYVYTVGVGQKDFRIFSFLENKRDPAFKVNLTEVCGKNVQCRWYVE